MAAAELSDLALATHAAQEAGSRVLDIRRQWGPIVLEDVESRNALKDAGDAAAHELLVEILSAHRPNDAIFSEEAIDDLARLTADRVWIIDPVDGTSEYGRGQSDWAIQVALWERSASSPEQLTVGVINLAAQDELFTSADPEPIHRTINPNLPIRIVMSRSRGVKFTKEALEQFSAGVADAGLTEHGVELMHVGGVGAKVGELLLDRADLYLHTKSFNQWDVAAPLAVAQHHGLVATRIDGSPVLFNHESPTIDDLVVAVPALADHLPALGLDELDS